MLSPLMFNKIQGLKIASGRATWEYNDEAENGGYYNFVDEDSFKWGITKQQLMQINVDEQDILDCVKQAEEQFKSPEVHRAALGLQPSAGWANIGATYISRTNKQVSCVFTPMAASFPTTNPIAFDLTPVDAYFEWYFSQEPLVKQGEPLKDFLAYYDTVTGSRSTNVTVSPVLNVPSYEEAFVMSDGIMSEDKREHFLQQVWNYHKIAPKYNRSGLEKSIIETIVKINKAKAILEISKV